MKDLYDYLTGAIEDSVNIEHDESSSRSITKKRKSNEKGTAGGVLQQSKQTRVNGQISMENPSRDRNQLLTSPNIDYTYALKLYEQAHLKQHTGQDSASVSGEGVTASLKKKKDYRLPIIIVPSTSTALMSMFNIKQVRTYIYILTLCPFHRFKLSISLSVPVRRQVYGGC